MKINKIDIEKLTDTIYKNEIQVVDDSMVYCEVQHKRDRSSFAGMALKITNQSNDIIVRKSEEKKLHDISKYEKLYLGCEEDYVEAIREIYLLEPRNYGIEILFLVYSDVRSSRVIFEELMKYVNEEIYILAKLCDIS